MRNVMSIVIRFYKLTDYLSWRSVECGGLRVQLRYNAVKSKQLRVLIGVRPKIRLCCLMTKNVFSLPIIEKVKQFYLIYDNMY